jgi:hypothetical protein
VQLFLAIDLKPRLAKFVQPLKELAAKKQRVFHSLLEMPHSLGGFNRAKKRLQHLETHPNIASGWSLF